MGRLTMKDYKKSPLHDLCGISTDCVVDCEDCFVIKLYEKLAHYEDMEEAGRLIELPCAIGTRIYFILENNEIDSMLIDNVQTALFFKDVNGNLKKGFYLTKEEAEAKLKELEGKDTNVPSKWIPCSERLPEEGAIVLVSLEEDEDWSWVRLVREGYYEEGYWFDTNGAHYGLEILAWMPLPQPYVEGDKE